MLFKAVLIVPILWIVVDGARILAVFPFPSFSHQVIFRSLTMELAQRGHDLLIFTTNPVNDPSLQNYTEIDLHHYYHSYDTFDFYSLRTKGFWWFLSEVYKYCENGTERTLAHPVMQRILSPNSTEKFDLLLIQSLYYDALYGIAYRLDVPIIAVVPNPLLVIAHYIFGNSLSMAYAPDIFTSFDENMNIWQRLTNIYYYLRQIIEYRLLAIPIQDKIRKKYFGDSVPPAHQLSSRFNLILANAHPFFTYPRPNVPGIIYIGGCHLTTKKKQLPQDLETILNDAKEGYIYFSLGSNIKSNLLPAEIREKLLRTFAKLPYKVLWKFESDYIEDKPDNVIIRKWLSQQEILAHPNIRLFIYQGGLQSTEEAIENMVPLISFPIFSDQMYNAKKLQFYGIGKVVQLEDVTEEILRETILEVITNSSYKENIQKLRNLLQDLPYNPIDNAMWWIEHVIRHKGAPHLRNKSRDMSWYQVELLDIMVIMFIIAILVVCIIVAIKRYVFRMTKQLILKLKTKLKRNNVKKRQ